MQGTAHAAGCSSWGWGQAKPEPTFPYPYAVRHASYVLLVPLGSWAARCPPLSSLHACPTTIPNPLHPQYVRTAPSVFLHPRPHPWAPDPPMQVTWALQRCPAPVSGSHARSAKAMASRHSALPPGVSGALSPSSCTEQGAGRRGRRQAGRVQGWVSNASQPCATFVIHGFGDWVLPVAPGAWGMHGTE